MKSQRVIIQVKADEQYFPMDVFPLMLLNVILIVFKSVTIHRNFSWCCLVAKLVTFRNNHYTLVIPFSDSQA